LTFGIFAAYYHEQPEFRDNRFIPVIGVLGTVSVDHLHLHTSIYPLRDIRRNIRIKNANIKAGDTVPWSTNHHTTRREMAQVSKADDLGRMDSLYCVPHCSKLRH
jgi:hypothetical protein